MRFLHSVVIPCYRESRRLPFFLSELIPALRKAALPPVKFWFVDDGSGKQEKKALGAALQKSFHDAPEIPWELLCLEENQGIGGAVYAGFRQALPYTEQGLCFVDADGSVPPEELIRFLRKFDRSSEWDCLIGSRIRMLGKEVKRKPLRHLTGRIFATLVKIFTDINVYDSQCGLKIIKKSAFQKIKGHLKEKRYTFDVELLFVLLRNGFSVKEIPVSWSEKPGARISLIKDGIKMFFCLIKITIY